MKTIELVRLKAERVMNGSHFGGDLFDLDDK